MAGDPFDIRVDRERNDGRRVVGEAASLGFLFGGMAKYMDRAGSKDLEGASATS